MENAIRVGNVSARQFFNEDIRCSLRDLAVPIELAKRDGLRLILKGDVLLDIISRIEPEMAKTLRDQYREGNFLESIDDALSALMNQLAYDKPLPKSGFRGEEITQPMFEILVETIGEHNDTDEDCLEGCREADLATLREVMKRFQAGYREEFKASEARFVKYSYGVDVRIEDDIVVIPTLLGDMMLDADKSATLLDAVRDFLQTYAPAHITASEKQMDGFRVRRLPAHEAMMDEKWDPDTLDEAAVFDFFVRVRRAKKMYF